MVAFVELDSIRKSAADEIISMIKDRDDKELIKHVSSGAAPDFKNEYGQISTASLSTILRKIIELEQQGADLFFGELSFEIEDLLVFEKDDLTVVNLEGPLTTASNHLEKEFPFSGAPEYTKILTSSFVSTSINLRGLLSKLKFTSV